MTHATATMPFRPVADRLLAVAFAALTQVEVWVLSADAGYSVAVRAGAASLTLVAAAALALRRTRPALAFWLNGLAVIGVIAVGYRSDVYQWTNLVVLYSIGAHGRGLQPWAALPVSVGGVLFYFARFPDEGGATLAAFMAAMWVVAWLAGRIYGVRLEEMRLRYERDVSRRLVEANEERLALQDERNRIARELHDIIGHSISVMVVHAGAGRHQVDGDSAVANVFTTIERTGRTTLSEMDRVLALLRHDEAGGDLLPAPGLADLGDLAVTLTETGLVVGLDVTGDVGGVPASVGLAAYRIVQEALTNTLKHAGAGAADVHVAIGDGRLDLTVADDGRGDPATLRPGRGLLGMGERAAVHGGTVGFDRSDGGGLVVTAGLIWDPSP